MFQGILVVLCCMFDANDSLSAVIVVEMHTQAQKNPKHINNWSWMSVAGDRFKSFANFVKCSWFGEKNHNTCLIKSL